MITKDYPVTNEIQEQEKGFSAQSGEVIGYEKGAKMVKNYFDQNDEEVSAHFLSRNIIEAVLGQPNAVGISIVYGLDENGQNKPVVTGVDAQGNFILNSVTVGGNGEMKNQKGLITCGGVISPGVPHGEGW